MSKTDKQPAPLQTTRGRQKDDNIDDLGRRPDGSKLDQPVKPVRDVRDKPLKSGPGVVRHG
jgi:hypothetical protein